MIDATKTLLSDQRVGELVHVLLDVRVAVAVAVSRRRRHRSSRAHVTLPTRPPFEEARETAIGVALVMLVILLFAFMTYRH